MKMELNFSQKLFYFFPVLFCFCLPFGGLLLSGIILLWGVTAFANIRSLFIPAGFKKTELILFFLFFFLTVVSAFFSSNRSDAIFNVEVKLSMIALPFFFFCFKWPADVLKRCLIAFVSGCFFACLYLLCRAFYFALQGQPDYFFYTLFSQLIHASYFAMYLLLACAIVMVYYPVWFSASNKLLRLSLLFLITFIICIFLCSSKMGLIGLFIGMPVILFYRYRSLFKWTNGIVLMILLIGVFVILSKVFPAPFERLRSVVNISQTNVDKASAESTTVRMLIWKECTDLIKENFWTGTGVGDLNEALFQKYERNGMTGALQHHLNAHNQYLQTFAGGGIALFIVLLLLTVWQLIKSIMQKHFLLFFVMLLIVINFLVESMLQTSAGNLFYVFFLCMFSLPQSKNDIAV